MSTVQSFNFRQWIKARDNPVSAALYGLAKGLRGFSLPVIPFVHKALYRLHGALKALWQDIWRIFYYTPLLQSRLKAPAPQLYLYGGLPLILGPLELEFGKNCRISGQTTFSGRGASCEVPQLILGDNIDIGWQTTIAVGRRVLIGDNVRIAGRAFLAGYPGHPLDAAARAAGLPDLDSQIGDIIVERDVWLATGVTVSAGVTIGEGTIVAAGSVVTKSLPPFVLAGGAPARIIRSLKDTQNAA